MKQITLTSKDFAEKIVASYELVKKGYKIQVEHWSFLNAVRDVAGDEIIKEACDLTDEIEKSQVKTPEKVYNNYLEVLMIMRNGNGQTIMGIYPTVQDALEDMSKFWKSTTWLEKDEDVMIYGVTTESNGYKHTTENALYIAKTSQFWGGRKPNIEEVNLKKTR